MKWHQHIESTELGVGAWRPRQNAYILQKRLMPRINGVDKIGNWASFNGFRTWWSRISAGTVFVRKTELWISWSLIEGLEHRLEFEFVNPTSTCLCLAKQWIRESVPLMAGQLDWVIFTWKQGFGRMQAANHHSVIWSSGTWCYKLRKESIKCFTCMWTKLSASKIWKSQNVLVKRRKDIDAEYYMCFSGRQCSP